MRRTVDAMVEMMDFRIAAKVAGRLATCLLAQGRLEEAQALLDEHRARLRKFSIRGGMASSVIMGLAAAALAAVGAVRGDGARRESQEGPTGLPSCAQAGEGGHDRVRPCRSLAGHLRVAPRATAQGREVVAEESRPRREARRSVRGRAHGARDGSPARRPLSPSRRPRWPSRPWAPSTAWRRLGLCSGASMRSQPRWPHPIEPPASAPVPRSPRLSCRSPEQGEARPEAHGQSTER